MIDLTRPYQVCAINELLFGLWSTRLDMAMMLA